MDQFWQKRAVNSPSMRVAIGSEERHKEVYVA